MKVTRYADQVDSKVLNVSGGVIEKEESLMLNDDDDFRDVYFYMNTETLKAILFICKAIKAAGKERIAADGKLAFKIEMNSNTVSIGTCCKEKDYLYHQEGKIKMPNMELPVTMRKGYVYTLSGIQPWMFEVPLSELNGTIDISTYLCYRFDFETGLKKNSYNVISLEV